MKQETPWTRTPCFFNKKRTKKASLFPSRRWKRTPPNRLALYGDREVPLQPLQRFHFMRPGGCERFLSSLLRGHGIFNVVRKVDVTCIASSLTPDERMALLVPKTCGICTEILSQVEEYARRASGRTGSGVDAIGKQIHVLKRPIVSGVTFISMLELMSMTIEAVLRGDAARRRVVLGALWAKRRPSKSRDRKSASQQA